MSSYIDFEVAKSIDYIGIPWTKISKKLETRSKDDCRNRWYLQIYNSIFEKSSFSIRDDKKLFKAIKKQDIETEEEINFSKIKNGRTENENKYRWTKLKKLVNSRYVYDTDSLMNALSSYFKEFGKSKNVD